MEFVKNTELKLAMAFLRKACGYERYLRVRAAQEGKTDLTEWQEVLILSRRMRDDTEALKNGRKHRSFTGNNCNAGKL